MDLRLVCVWSAYDMLATMDTRTFFGKCMQMTRNAITARKGNAAERHMCEQVEPKQKLEAYFGKPISSMRLVSGKKKSDIEIVLEDGTIARLQNKEGGGEASRGWSADRRSVDRMPMDDAGKQLLSVVCLKKEGERPVDVARPPSLIRDLLLGTDPNTMPTHFTHTEFDTETNKIRQLSIAPAETVLTALEDMAHPHLVAKRTCVHIAPGMYLQRKGGGVHDSAPDDIQLKIVKFPPVMTSLM